MRTDERMGGMSGWKQREGRRIPKLPVPPSNHAGNSAGHQQPCRHFCRSPAILPANPAVICHREVCRVHDGRLSSISAIAAAGLVASVQYSQKITEAINEERKASLPPANLEQHIRPFVCPSNSVPSSDLFLPKHDQFSLLQVRGGIGG